MKYEIKLAEVNDTDSIVHLLNTVTLKLHKKNINQWIYPWNYKEIERDIKNKNIYKLTRNQVIIGTFSIKEIGNKSWQKGIMANDLYLYRIALQPEYQGNNIGKQIIDFTFDISKNKKKKLYLDCWAGNEKLKNFYTKSGFEFCGDFSEEDYMISVFKYEEKM